MKDRRQRQRTTQRREGLRRLLRILFLFASITLFVVIVGAISFAKPRVISCQTVQNTYCPASLDPLLTNMKQTSWWRLPKQYESWQKSMKQTEPNITMVRFQRRWHGRLDVSIEPAAPIFPLHVQNQHWLVHSNGFVSSVDTPGTPLVQLGNDAESGFASQTLHWSASELTSFAKLYAQLEKFSPTITKIRYESPTEIWAFPEGYGPIILTAENETAINRQVATLQAFFHSTTMDTAYTELDVRYQDIIIR